MSTQAEAPAVPDLSSLTKRQQLNAAVAHTQGWQVRISDEDDAPDFEAGELIGLPPDWLQRDPFACILDEEDANDRPDSSDWTWVPDYAGDPSAWGALMEKEGVWAEPFTVGGSQKVLSWLGAKISGIDEESSDYTRKYGGKMIVGEAVCAAVLEKHGVDPSPYIED